MFLRGMVRFLMIHCQFVLEFHFARRPFGPGWVAEGVSSFYVSVWPVRRCDSEPLEVWRSDDARVHSLTLSLDGTAVIGGYYVQVLSWMTVSWSVNGTSLCAPPPRRYQAPSDKRKALGQWSRSKG